MTIFNLILLFKLHRGVETKTPLDDFQMLWVVFPVMHHPFRTLFAFRTLWGSALTECPQETAVRYMDTFRKHVGSRVAGGRVRAL